MTVGEPALPAVHGQHHIGDHHGVVTADGQGVLVERPDVVHGQARGDQDAVHPVHPRRVALRPLVGNGQGTIVALSPQRPPTLEHVRAVAHEVLDVRISQAVVSPDGEEGGLVTVGILRVDDD